MIVNESRIKIVRKHFDNVITYMYLSLFKYLIDGEFG